MRNINETVNAETDAALAAAAILLNLLIVLIVSGGIWVFYSMVSRVGALETLMRESFRL